MLHRSFGRVVGLLLLLGWSGLASASERNVVLLVLDGTRADRVEALLAEGRLPNLREHVVDRGLTVDTAVTVFPSTTGPTYAPFVTGRVPGTSGITGLRWYDRTTGRSYIYAGRQFGQINDALDPEAPTIYELLPGDASAAVFGMVDRGCEHTEMPVFSIGPAKLRGDYVGMDRKLYEKFRGAVLERDPFPRFSFLSFHAPDSVGHARGVEDPDYDRSLEAIDAHLGDMVRILEERGLYHSTYFVISADHGQTSVTERMSLAEHLEGYDLAVRDSVAREPFFQNLFKGSRREKYDVHVEVNGNAAVFFYLNVEDTDPSLRVDSDTARAFPSRGGATVDIEDALLDAPAVELVLSRRGPGSYRVASRRGAARIDGDRAGLGYRVVDGEDPLGYADHPAAAPLVDGAARPADTWLAATRETDFPDAPYQIAQLLESPRAPDLVVSAAPGWEPWLEGQAGLHGGLRKEHMRVPLLVGGPGIVPRRLAQARTVDVFPTVCEILGVEVPAGQDGRALPWRDTAGRRRSAFRALHGE